MPGDTRTSYEHTNQARQILNDAEDDLKDWQPELEDVPSSAQLEKNGMAREQRQQQYTIGQGIDDSLVGGSTMGDESATRGGAYGTHDHIAGEHAVMGQGGSRISTGSSMETGQAYAPSSVATGLDDYAPSEGTTHHIAA